MRVSHLPERLAVSAAGRVRRASWPELALTTERSIAQGNLVAPDGQCFFSTVSTSGSILSTRTVRHALGDELMDAHPFGG